jgi:hypothetical protein
MSQQRRVTRACAERDWIVSTHDEVVANNQADDLLQLFLNKSSLAYCHRGRNRMERSRWVPKGAPRPGPHMLGNMHIKAPAARRAWLWRDTGELDPAGKLFTLDWMIAHGARRQGHSTDLQESHKDILLDSHDTWLPTTDDYADLAAEVDAERLRLAMEAVSNASQDAQAHPGQLVRANTAPVIASVGQEHAVPVQISVGVIQDYSERWIIIGRLDANNQPVDEDVALVLAQAGFEEVDEDDIEQVYRLTKILDGAHTIDPGRVYAWTALV